MKLNWGWGVFIAFLMFGAMIITMVVKSFDVPVNMVTKNYYAEEKGLEERKDKMANVSTLSAQPQINYQAESKSVSIVFPEEITKPEGKVRFFRPSDSRLDFTVDMNQFEEGKIEVPVSNIVGGRWVVILDWVEGEQAYYFEKSVTLP